MSLKVVKGISTVLPIATNLSNSTLQNTASAPFSNRHVRKRVNSYLLMAIQWKIANADVTILKDIPFLYGLEIIDFVNQTRRIVRVILLPALEIVY